jgi:hypothetical protein
MSKAMATKKPSDAAVAKSLARLWPNRMHESSFLKNFFCHVGLHRWAQPSLHQHVPSQETVRFCRWCSKIKVNEVIYEP